MKIKAFSSKLVNASLVNFGRSSTYLLGKLVGEAFPFYYVTEYPRSGGTWAGRMLSDYLQIPFPQYPKLPMGCQCMIHNHCAYSPRFKRVFYVYRDGRDVAVSMYFYSLKRKRADSVVRTNRLRRLLGDAWDAPDAEEAWKYLPRFIENWVRQPFSCEASWPDYIDQWLGKPGVVALRYEDLLRDCHGTLSRALAEHLGEEPDPDRVSWAVEKFSFARQAGRRPGQEDRGSFFRKGIAGDWRNHFTEEAAQVFEHYCGDTLRSLGYAKDKDWFRNESGQGKLTQRPLERDLLAKPVG